MSDKDELIRELTSSLKEVLNEYQREMKENYSDAAPPKMVAIAFEKGPEVIRAREALKRAKAASALANRSGQGGGER